MRHELRLLVTFLIAAHNAEVVPGRVGEHHPAGAIGFAPVGNCGCAECHDSLDFIVSASIRGGQVHVQSTGRILELLDFDEQQTLVTVRIENHALLVARLVRIVRNIDVAENSLPPFREFEGVGAMNARVRQT